MAKLMANDRRIWIESATPGTYNEIKGQTGTSINRNGSTIDISSKSDFPYAAQAAGARSGSIPFEIIPDLPDANGYGRLESLANATTSTPFNIEIRRNGSLGADPADVLFKGSVYVTDFNTSLGQNDAVKVSGTFVFNGAPVIDTLL